jgi:4-hydroxy-tetrahydrodipicolinate reductase
MTHAVYLPGIAGRMGRAIAESVAEAEDFHLAGAFEAPGHEWIGKKLSEVFPAAGADCVVAEKPEGPPPQGSAGIHFTWPEPTLEWLDWSAGNNCPMIVGTTGFDEGQMARIRQAAERIPIVLAPNMSVGVNILFALAEKTAKTLGTDFDVEIVEMHHRFKKDAPSGTALRVGEIIAEAQGLDFASQAVHGRQGMIGERPRGQIGFHAIRAGDVVAEVSTIFAGMGERMELTHRASSRRTFAEGALRAARYLDGRDAGLYDMQDVLGLR